MKKFFCIAALYLSLLFTGLLEAGQTREEVQQLRDMVSIRAQAMSEKNLETLLKQFSPAVTWINSQGYFFEGIDSVTDFHKMLLSDEQRDYAYEAGQPKIRMIDSNNALVYYSWKMLWHKPGDTSDIMHEEIGLMTLTAKKHNDQWIWLAVTNQHTPYFYENIESVQVH